MEGRGAQAHLCHPDQEARNALALLVRTSLPLFLPPSFPSPSCPWACCLHDDHWTASSPVLPSLSSGFSPTSPLSQILSLSPVPHGFPQWPGEEPSCSAPTFVPSTSSLQLALGPVCSLQESSSIFSKNRRSLPDTATNHDPATLRVPSQRVPVSVEVFARPPLQNQDGNALTLIHGHRPCPRTAPGRELALRPDAE